MDDVRVLGRVMNYDPATNRVILELDFVAPEIQEELEKVLIERTILSFCFSKPFRRSKTYEQLKMYYGMLKRILVKLNVFPNADTIKAFDIEIKKNVLPCKFLEVYGDRIPLIPSKANMSVDEMNVLINAVQENYKGVLND